MNRVDMAPAAAVGQWKRYLVNEGGLRADNRAGNVPAFFVDSKKGKGVHEVLVHGISSWFDAMQRRACKLFYQGWGGRLS